MKNNLLRNNEEKKQKLKEYQRKYYEAKNDTYYLSVILCYIIFSLVFF